MCPDTSKWTRSPRIARRRRAAMAAEWLETRLCLSALSFAAPRTSPRGGADRVAVVDVNADGRPDVVTSDYGGDAVSILLNAGAGRLAGPARFPVGDGPQSLAVGDFDGDGLPDLVTANARGGDATVLHNLGGGRFGAPAHVGTRGSPAAVAVGDFNGDGRPDLAVAAADQDAVHVLINRGDGTAFHHVRRARHRGVPVVPRRGGL